MDRVRIAAESCNLGVGLVFSSSQTTTALSVTSFAVRKLYRSLDKTKARVYHLTVWGEYDVIGIVYTESTKQLLELSRIAPGIGPGIRSFEIKLGTVLYSDDGFERNLERLENPIKAVCRIKCNRNFIRNSSVNPKARTDVWSFFNEFTNICLTERAKMFSGNSGLDNRVLLQIVAPYSWNDFIIVLQTKSINIVKRYISALRHLTFPNPKPGKRHLTYSTRTIIGIPFFRQATIKSP
jgi:hypothetical protein